MIPWKYCLLGSLRVRVRMAHVYIEFVIFRVRLVEMGASFLRTITVRTRILRGSVEIQPRRRASHKSSETKQGGTGKSQPQLCPWTYGFCIGAALGPSEGVSLEEVSGTQQVGMPHHHHQPGDFGSGKSVDIAFPARLLHSKADACQSCQANDKRSVGQLDTSTTTTPLINVRLST